MSAGADLAQEFAAKLSEHFDSVIILCTVQEEGATRVVVKRLGNYYATKGLMQEWLEEEVNEDLAQKLRPEEEE